jgi:hypothetical protein
MIMNGIEKIKNIDILIIVKQEYNINEWNNNKKLFLSLYEKIK